MIAETVASYSGLSWVLLLVAALLVGVSKTLLPGISTISVAIFASVMPAKISTGALLLLLMVGDAMALLAYRRSARWDVLVRMVPAVLLGLVLGAVFLNFAADGTVRRGIGWLLIVLMGITLWQRWSASRSGGSISGGGTGAGRAGRTGSLIFGGLGGFSTMVANSGGPVMSMYFLTQRFEVKAFLGTAAWFFAVMNALKLPFSLSLGLVNPHVVGVDLLLLPAVLMGGAIGWVSSSRINQRFFDGLIIVITLGGAIYLVL